MKTVKFLFLSGVVLFTACASSSSARPSSNSNVITLEQLANVSGDNAFEAIRALQPHWLDTRDSESISNQGPVSAVVFLNGARAGGLEFLRTIQITSLEEIRFIPASQAAARYGMGLGRGVIDLTSRGYKR